jgi:hypothetical protein
MEAIAADEWDDPSPPTRKLIELVGDGFGDWQPAPPRPGESHRWERSSGEWVAVAECGPEIVVQDWRGHRQRVERIEEALQLARARCC